MPNVLIQVLWRRRFALVWWSLDVLAADVCRNTLSVSSNAAPPASGRVTLWRIRRREPWG